jgi:hypothetical protein
MKHKCENIQILLLRTILDQNYIEEIKRWLNLRNSSYTYKLKYTITLHVVLCECEALCPKLQEGYRLGIIDSKVQRNIFEWKREAVTEGNCNMELNK